MRPGSRGEHLEPVGLGNGIRIEQRNELAVVEHADPDVVRGGEADVPVEHDELHADG